MELLILCQSRTCNISDYCEAVELGATGKVMCMDYNGNYLYSHSLYTTRRPKDAHKSLWPYTFCNFPKIALGWLKELYGFGFWQGVIGLLLFGFGVCVMLGIICLRCCNPKHAVPMFTQTILGESHRHELVYTPFFLWIEIRRPYTICMWKLWS